MKKWNYILVVFLSIITFSILSCSNDDDGAKPIESTDNNQNEDNSLKNLTLYKVDGENIIKQKDFDVTGNALVLQKDIKKHQEIWNLTKKIIPLDYRSKMNEFMIYYGDESEEEGVLGYVVERTKDLSKWQMGIAIDYAYEGGFNAKGELAYTIIHEFGHIITLDDTQVDSSIEESNCQNFYTGEGCARDNSNINQLQKKHWADIWDEFQNANSETEAQAFYDKYKDRYVTQYASTNPGEDIAEVFATFTTREKGVSGNSKAEQKIQIMYDDDKMIKLRNYIRGNIAKSNRNFLPNPGSWKRANSIGDKNKSHCRLHKN
ncbi:hypothetical protein [Aquimarina sp. AU119]|uniref:hypothetical protein n=1 Tax=Aquimarina sp. AU119 TaxID=2108528 RepID=UPI000D6927E5|nr:hypothetical protein [Aquimarina sp. AU119]